MNQQCVGLKRIARAADSFVQWNCNVAAFRVIAARSSQQHNRNGLHGTPKSAALGWDTQHSFLAYFNIALA